MLPILTDTSFHLLDHILENNHIDTASNKNARNCPHHPTIHFDGLDSVRKINRAIALKAEQKKLKNVFEFYHQFKNFE